MRFPIIKLRKVWYSISAVLILISLYGIFAYGFNLSLHFTGGAEIKYSFTENIPTTGNVVDTIKATEETYNSSLLEDDKINLGAPVVVASGTDAVNVRLRIPSNLSDEAEQRYDDFRATLDTAMKDTYSAKKESSIAISPSVGEELKDKALLATALAIIAIVLYIIFAFRKLPKNYRPVVFGANTILALIHDVLILLGVFVFLGAYFHVEIGPFFITAVLTVLGYSVNDTIVVYDRVRENMMLHKHKDITAVTEESVWQTMARSINTSVTVLITLAALLILGADSIRMFVWALFIGVIVGTYSSIFIASPLLVTFKNALLRKKK